MSEYQVGSIMRTDILTLTPAVPIRRAVALIVEHRAAAAPVLSEDGSLVGLLTQKDCFRPALQASYYQEWKGNVADFMVAEVVSVPVTLDAIGAAETFLSCPHRVLPVLDGQRLSGLLHRSDVLALLARKG